MNIEKFKAAITNEFARQMLRKSFVKMGLPDSVYSVDHLHISQTPQKDYEGTLELVTKGARIIINFLMKSPLTREMSMSVCPIGPPMEIEGTTVHTFLGVFLPKRAGPGKEKQGQLIQLFDA